MKKIMTTSYLPRIYTESFKYNNIFETLMLNIECEPNYLQDASFLHYCKQPMWLTNLSLETTFFSWWRTDLKKSKIKTTFLGVYLLKLVISAEIMP